MGSGASTLWSTVKVLKDGALVAEFDLAATSGGRGGLAATGSFAQAHIEDTAGTAAEFFADRVK